MKCNRCLIDFSSGKPTDVNNKSYAPGLLQMLDDQDGISICSSAALICDCGLRYWEEARQSDNGKVFIKMVINPRDEGLIRLNNKKAYIFEGYTRNRGLCGRE